MERILNKLLIIAFSIFLILLSLLIYFLFLKPSPLKNLKIQIQGPSEISSLEPAKYQIKVINETKTKITGTSLKISLSDGGFFPDLTKERSILIGDIGPQQSFQQDIEVYFLNTGGLKEEIKISFYYKIENKENVFEKSESFFVLVKNPPIKVQIFLPSKIYVNQQFQTNFQISNLTNQRLDNVQITVETPENFLFVSSFPQTSGFYWDLGSFEPNETKTITLIGQIQSIQSSGVFTAKVNYSFQGRQFSLPKEFAKTSIIENPVSFQIETDPAENNINIGKGITYNITIKNKSQTTLKNNEVKVTFIGPFDIFSLQSDGYPDRIEKSVYWNPRNKNELTSLKPGDEVNINFSINLYESYPILSDNDKNFVAKIRVEFRTPTIPAEIGDQSLKEYVVYQEVDKKIIGSINIDHWLAYEKNYPQSKGPFPLESNKKTLLNWHILISTLGEDFQDFVISTKFPAGVNFTGKYAGDVLKENIYFNQTEGTFQYRIKNLPANLGYKQKKLELIFQLEVEPPAYEHLYTWEIIPEIQYSAKGAFTQADITGELYKILPTDIKKQ